MAPARLLISACVAQRLALHSRTHPFAMTAPLFPLFTDLQGRRVLVVGGGSVARRKIDALLASGAHVVVGAPVLEPDVEALVSEGRIEHVPGRFDPNWLNNAWL